jgi:5-methylcytosine-specific restriction endonuclease McrBC regulatory subunit McrC
LVPDVWLEQDSTTIIVDAKYKRHWEEMQHHSWHSADEILKEAHRNDLFQVMAYANLARTPRVIACLAYPCTPDTWASMLDRGRLIHKADVTTGSRSMSVWLTAVPMATEADKIAIPLTDELRRAAM